MTNPPFSVFPKPPAPPPSEAESVEYIANLARIEQKPGYTQIIIKIGPYSAFLLISALQLATRLPDIGDELQSVLQAVIGQLKTPFRGTLGERILDMLDMGDDPDLDVENPQEGNSL